MGWLSQRFIFWWEAFGLWWLGVAVLWSIFSTAATLRDEFLSPERQERWRTLRVMPKLPLYVWVIGLLIITLLAAMEGAFRAVRDERTRTAEAEGKVSDAVALLAEERKKADPDLRGEIQGGSFGSNPNSNLTTVTLFVRITNFGAQSIVRDYGLAIDLGRPIDIGIFHPHGDTLYLMRDNEPTVKYPVADAIYTQTTKPILTGDMKEGFIAFALADTTKQEVYNARRSIRLSYYDFKGKSYSISYPINLESAREAPTFMPGAPFEFGEPPNKRQKKP